MDFSRISQAVDLNLLKNTHIVGIGTGGAYSLYEGLVRSGIGSLTVFDFDTVDDVNLCRQGFKPDEIGMDKIDALGDHLLSINPDLNYTGLPWDVLDCSDSELDRIFGNADLFLFMTDSFPAQAFGNKLALKYKKPAIWGGFYEKSQCAEIVFYIPDVTPACFRCAVAPRYAVQAEGEVKVSSNCNTIFHSMLLDSMVGMLVMAILHNDTEGFEFSGYFGDYWDQNLIQFKCALDYPSRLFGEMFMNTGGRAINFNSIWQRIPGNCECQDCSK